MAQADTNWPAAARSATLREKIKNARVLAVGAGGIGCELLKTLVLSGFENIVVVDLDTIDISNLNRQFLFRKEHVGQAKAKVAAEAVRRFRPNARIDAHQGNIKDAKYDVDFFRGFDIVLNGLDNLEARRHVNRLCLAAEVPLVESGTEGYNGQVTVHMRTKDAAGQEFKTDCYECQGKAAPKTYPVCTIRNTPDKPIHCVVWAKELLFARLFGRPDVKTDLDEETRPGGAAVPSADGAALPNDHALPNGDAQPGDAAAAPSGANGAADGPVEDEASSFLREEGESATDYALRIFNRVFVSDINNVLKMEDLWKTRRPPTPLSLDNMQGFPAAPSDGSAKGRCASKTLGLADPQRVWTLEENAQVFLESIRAFLEDRPDEVGAAVFDKDDALAVDFVTAASNLRSIAYGIPPQSAFATKGMAGNIVHAIATTNAIISGLIVVEAMKIVSDLHKSCKMTWLSKAPSGCRVRQLLVPEPLGEPNPSCVVCGTSQLQLCIDTARTTLAVFIDKVLKKRLSMNEPTIQCGDLLYEEGEGLDPDEVADYQQLLPQTLADLPGGGLSHGAIVSVKDQAQDFDVKIVVNHQGEWDEEKEPDLFTLTGEVAAPSVPAGETLPPDEESDDDDFAVVEVTEQRPKRKREAEADGHEFEQEGKRVKAAPSVEATSSDADIVVLD